MKKNTRLPILTIYLILMVTIIILLTLALTSGETSALEIDSSLIGIEIIASLLALAAGFLYLVLGYKKNVALYYKLFMIFSLASYVLNVTNLIMSEGSLTWWYALISVVALVFMTLLAFGKDLGVNKTYTFVIVLLVCKIIVIARIVFLGVDYFGDIYNMFLITEICRFILGITTGFLAIGKYTDKQERGAK